MIYGLPTESKKKNDELYHFGVKGMKWGVRRYQNPDGSLIREGKKRYRSVKKIASNYKDNIPTKMKKIASQIDEEVIDKLRRTARQENSARQKLESSYSKELEKAYKDAVRQHKVACENAAKEWLGKYSEELIIPAGKFERKNRQSISRYVASLLADYTLIYDD